MKNTPSRSAALLFLLGLCALPFACTTPSESDPSPTPTTGGPLEPAPEPIPWTDSFRTATIVVAEEVRIEGPKGLLEHVATLPEPEFHDYVVRTRPEGFEQTITPKDPKSVVEITAVFDAWRLVALRRLVVLERPGDVDVRVEAIGDVFWRDATTGEEKRASALTWTGKRPE